MRALITGTPVQIEGDPAEIAQLVELMSTGAVMVEHVHHWRLDLPDDEGLQMGRCWCGTEKTFAPFDRPHAIAVKAGQAGAAGRAAAIAKKTRGGAHPCGECGEVGHNRRTCPQMKTDAATAAA